MTKPALSNKVAERRNQAGMAAQELARRIGATRQALHAIETGRTVPSTTLALALARTLECRVEDLFALEDTQAAQVTATLVNDASPNSARVVLGHVDKGWVAYPLDAQQPAAWSSAADGVLDATAKHERGAKVKVRPIGSLDAARENVLIAGCAPALSVLSRRLSERPDGTRLRWINAGSEHALSLLANRQAHIAGLHLLDEASGEFNVPIVKRRMPRHAMTVITLARWQQGLVVRKDNPLSIRGVEDLLRRDVRFVGRESHAGAHKLIERLMRDLTRTSHAPSLPQASAIGHGHMEVAQAVAMGAADVGVAIHSAALAYDLRFIPLADERFDLVMPKALTDNPRIARVLDLLDSQVFRDELSSLGGYETSSTGHVVT